MALSEILSGKSVSVIPKDVWEFMFINVLNLTPYQVQNMPKHVFDKYAPMVDYKFRHDARKGIM